MAVTKVQAMERIAANEMLTELYEVEQETMERIITMGLSFTGGNRWRRFEEMKRVMKGIAGWKARNESLRWSCYYDAMESFMNWLLPE